MAFRHDPCDRAEATSDLTVPLHERRQPTVGRHAPHQHRVVHHSALVVDDLLDTEVDVRAEPAVQLDLLVAHPFAALRRAEVDEGEPHRLLALVHQVAVEDERGHVGLDELDTLS